MKKTTIAILIFFCFNQMINAQSSVENQVLLTLDGKHQVTKSDFERIYHKNNNPELDLGKTEVDEYLELFINFRLKVLEAINLGLDTMESFQSELNGYREQLAKPYLIDSSIDDVLIREAYERMKKEVNVSHILIKCEETALPKDTVYAYNKAMDVRQRILRGEDFSTVARAVSDDPSVTQNNGDLGFITVFRAVYPFETAAFNTPKGEISLPVRTNFGYHIIKVNDIRPAKGEVLTAHIMKLVSRDATEEESEEAKKIIYQLYDSLKVGEDFSRLARLYSDDQRSANSDGRLPWFSTGRMVQEFEQAAFAIENIGDISEPVQSAFGWHIIKLLDTRGIPDFEEAENDIRQRIARDERGEYGRKLLVKKLKKDYDYKENAKNINIFYNLIDSSIFRNEWDANLASGYNEVLFTIGDKKYTQFDFAKYITKQNFRRIMPIASLVNSTYEEFVEDMIIEYEKGMLEGKYPEFRYLMEEYHDGILLFELTDQKVWSKAVKDTTGLENFYQQNKLNYMWGERMDASIFTCEDEDVAKSAMRFAKRKARRNLSNNFIIEKVCKNDTTNTCLSIKNVVYERGVDDIIDNIEWKSGISDLKEVDDKVVFVLVNNILQPEPKKLSEARGLITADYQDYLEKEWIKELRDKYKVEVNEDVLSSIQ